MGLVYVVDGNTNTILDILKIPKPCGIAVNPKTNMIYVSSESTDSVIVIDGKTNEFLANVTTGHKPRGVGVNSDTNMVYITNTESNSVTVLDGLTNNVVTSIEVGETPWRIAVDSQANVIYATNNKSGDVSVIDGETNTVLKKMSVDSPFDITVDPSINKVYVTTLLTMVPLDGYQNEIASPKQQIFQGVLSEDVICKSGLELIFKITDKSPVCVKEQSAEKLIQRGWGVSVP